MFIVFPLNPAISLKIKHLQSCHLWFLFGYLLMHLAYAGNIRVRSLKLHFGCMKEGKATHTQMENHLLFLLCSADKIPVNGFHLIPGLN